MKTSKRSKEKMMRMLTWLKEYVQRLDADVIDEDRPFDWIFGLALVYVGFLFIFGYATLALPASPLPWFDPYATAVLCWIPAYHFLRRGMLGEQDDDR
jgi:hypothetical protein